MSYISQKFASLNDLINPPTADYFSVIFQTPGVYRVTSGISDFMIWDAYIWGAGGGGAGGAGACVKLGAIHVPIESTIDIVVGEPGVGMVGGRSYKTTTYNLSGGAGGNYTDEDGDTGPGYGGGGASGIIVNGTWIAVAAGGGGQGGAGDDGGGGGAGGGGRGDYGSLPPTTNPALGKGGAGGSNYSGGGAGGGGIVGGAGDGGAGDDTNGAGGGAGGYSYVNRTFGDYVVLPASGGTPGGAADIAYKAGYGGAGQGGRVVLMFSRTPHVWFKVNGEWKIIPNIWHRKEGTWESVGVIWYKFRKLWRLVYSGGTIATDKKANFFDR